MQLVPGTRGRALVLAVLAVPASLLAWPVGAALVCAAAGVRWFFRDPERSPPAAGVVSPADGRVTVLREEPPADGDAGGDEPGTRVRVGVFMSPTDVHVNRAPLPGTVRDVAHEPGGHWPAFSKASERNERLHVQAGDWRVTLVAGTLARRTHPRVEPGTPVERGERIGHISFGSRADVLLPAGVALDDVAVTPGDRVRAGETVLVPAAVLDAAGAGTDDSGAGRDAT
ncbi:MAG: protein sorting system archaetidylserine decarboxylase [Halobacteriaceae archaeon]